MSFGFLRRWILGELEMLELRNVCKAFGDVRVLGGVNLRLEKGFVYTLKGGNGSGKTTLINIISGFLKPDEGCFASLSTIKKGKNFMLMNSKLMVYGMKLETKK